MNRTSISILTLGVVALLVNPLAAMDDAPIVFTDIASTSGIVYQRGESLSDALFDVLKAAPLYTFESLIATPVKPRGAPGVVLFDFDDDGDLDIYATNGPGRDNSLFQNQLVESGSVTFVDVAASAGVAAFDQDSTGACAGDIDNDGDRDLYVLGNKEPNRLFENLGGSFVEISASSGADGDSRTSSSCSMGDVNNDGLLDIAYGNVFDMDTQRAIVVVPFALNQSNVLLLNQGNNVFSDVSDRSGVTEVAVPEGGSVEIPDTPATITWAIALVDLDLDGDTDIVHADDGGAFPRAPDGVDRALNHFFENDGTGHFTDRTIERGLAAAGGWMGLSFGDFDRNGRLDLFSTNFGNHPSSVTSGNTDFSTRTSDSRWFLQQLDGSFVDSFELNGPIHTPFGWGSSAADFDNDGDTDILFHGGLDVGSFVAASPAVLLENDGMAGFQRNAVAFATSTDHQRRTVHGMAVGDLDHDGFVDVVSVSAFDFPAPSFPLAPHAALGNPEFDVDARFFPTFRPADPSAPGFPFVWNGFDASDGTLSVEINSGNDNRWAQVDVQGTIGQTTRGKVNRDGIGAVLQFRPVGGEPVLQPILGGSSYASQDSLTATFGLGSAPFGTVDVTWPGGTKNRLHGVAHTERVLFPEIPCSFDDSSSSFGGYTVCVVTSLAELVLDDTLSGHEAARFGASAILAFLQTR